MHNILRSQGLALMLFCLVAPFSLYADSYKGVEWGADIQNLIDANEIEFGEGETEPNFSTSSYASDSLDEMMNIYFGVPFALNNPDQDPPTIPKSVGPVMGKILFRTAQTVYYRYYAEVLPEIKWVRGKSGDIAFFKNRYSFYTSEVKPVSFDAVLGKLKNKF
jgi:hypothetical protein